MCAPRAARGPHAGRPRRSPRVRLGVPSRAVSRNRLLSLSLLLLGGCGESAPPPATFDCAADPSLGLVLSERCPGAALRVLPAARIEGAWRGAGRDGACEAEAEGTLRCPVAELGELRATLTDDVIEVRFDAAQDVDVEGVSLEGEASLEGARAWISNGFQSWSQTGVIALGGPLEDAAIDAALAQRGDGEVVRRGSELSWEHTLIGGGGAHLLAGALSAARLRPWVRAWQEPGSSDVVRLRIASGASGERVSLAAGESLEGEPFFVALGDDPVALQTRYVDLLPSRRRAVERAADAGWNSWYELWDSVDEDAVRANAALAREVLGPRVPEGTPLRIVVDDGWQLAWGEWEPNEKFPSGLDGLAADLHADGFEVGVWLAPLLVDEDSALVSEHPAWFVEGASYLHAKNGSMRVLDVTHPEAAAHLASVIERIVGWGYDLLKIDFLFAGTFEGGRAEDVTPMQAYARALEIIRDAAGEDVILLAVGAPGLASFPHVDAWRVGPDIALEPFGAAWAWLPSQARTLAARAPYCRVTLCDADPPILRDLPREEVETGVWIAALAGGAFFLSDDLRELETERRGWGLDAERVALAIGGAPALPEDVLPENAPPTLANAFTDHARRTTTHVVPRIWRLPDGSRLALNVSDVEATIEGVSVPAHAARVLP